MCSSGVPKKNDFSVCGCHNRRPDMFPVPWTSPMRRRRLFTSLVALSSVCHVATAFHDPGGCLCYVIHVPVPRSEVVSQCMVALVFMPVWVGVFRLYQQPTDVYDTGNKIKPFLISNMVEQ